MAQESHVMQQPLVSVIMNCHNGEKYLRESLNSVIAQTYQNWEIIFWDNQSTDRSADLVRSTVDPRIKYFLAPRHTWLYEARNLAMEKASGGLIAFLDVDDWWMPEKLERQVPLFSDPEVGMVCSDFTIVCERRLKQWNWLKKPAPTGWVLDELLRFNFVGLPTLVVRRSALDSLEYRCDPRYHIIGDLDLVIRLAVKWKLDCVPQSTAFYRLHQDNESAKHRGRHIDELELWLREMSAVEAIKSRPTFGVMHSFIAYQKGIDRALAGDRSGAYRILRQIPWGRHKMRLAAILSLPVAVATRMKR